MMLINKMRKLMKLLNISIVFTSISEQRLKMERLKLL